MSIISASPQSGKMGQGYLVDTDKEILIPVKLDQCGLKLTQAKKVLKDHYFYLLRFYENCLNEKQKKFQKTFKLVQHYRSQIYLLQRMDDLSVIQQWKLKNCNHWDLTQDLKWETLKLAEIQEEVLESTKEISKVLEKINQFDVTWKDFK